MLVARGSEVRLPDLFRRNDSKALLYVPNRHGVAVTVLRTPSLARAELIQILTYRLAQYLLANQLDPLQVFESRLEHEPESNVSDEDVHVLAGDVSSGQLLCYITLKALYGCPPEVRMSSADRPMFPVEEVFGCGVYNRLRILPDLPVRRVREAGRFAKNHRPRCLDELMVRAPVEIMLALMRCLTGQLMQEFDVCIGDLEEGVAKKNHDYFHLPTVLIHGVVPYAPEGTFGFFNYQSRTRYPYAVLSADVPRARLDAIEQALERPGTEGMLALMALKQDARSTRSSLEPAGGLTPLTTVAVPQTGVPMAVRREQLDLGAWLRGSNLFQGLSVAEAAVLGTFMRLQTAAPGEVVIRQGDISDDLYLIQIGTAEVQVSDFAGERLVLATLGPGDTFGEIALVTGGERTADVVAVTAMTLMRLSHDDYVRYLEHVADVERHLARTAATRVRDTLRSVRPKASE